MKKHSKRYNDLIKLYDNDKSYSISEAVELVKKFATAKFNESVDANIVLGVNPKKAEENVRSTVTLPNGTGKEVRVLVFAQGEKEQEAIDAGADYVGLNDYIEKIQNEGWTDFEAIVATPDVMKFVGRLGKVLGPKGLMPNPKTGTVTFDIKDAVEKLKAGRIEFRVDKFGVMKMSIGKANFQPEEIKANLIALLKAIIAVKPISISSIRLYMKKVYISSSMSPGIKIDINEVISL
jgi:large subunit ribosomal protein L1